MDFDRFHRELSLLVRDIHESFRAVTREGGVSWNETRAIDGYADEEERARARASDTDTSWQELVDDQEWQPSEGYGGACFLDAIGFRYYLPVLMIRTLRRLSSDDPMTEYGVAFHLTPSKDPGLLGFHAEQFAALETEQRRCVARFVWYMVEWNPGVGQPDAESPWLEAWDAYWARYA